MLKPSSQLSFPMTIRFINNAHSLIISQLPHYNENFNVIRINSMYMPIRMPTKSQSQTEKPKYWIRNLILIQSALYDDWINLSNIDSHLAKKTNKRNWNLKKKKKKQTIRTWLQFLLLLYFQISQFKPIKTQHQKQQNQDLKILF